jgi:general stress protein 26
MDEMKPGTLDDLHRLIEGFDTCMLVSVTPDGRLHARPMQLQDRTRLPDCDLWFATAADTAKVGEIHWDHEVNVCCQRGDKGYLSLTGYALLEDDPVLIQRLYRSEWRVWLADDDAQSAVLIKLTIERAEFWPPEGGRPRLVYLAPPEELVKPFTGPAGR